MRQGRGLASVSLVQMSEYLAETMSTIEMPDHRVPDPTGGGGYTRRRVG